MGLPFYRKTFGRLGTSGPSGCAPVSGAGSSGPTMREAGFWAFTVSRLIGVEDALGKMLSLSKSPCCPSKALEMPRPGFSQR